MKKIETLLELQRKKLLDTSRRNLLLNYRMTNKAIEITSEWSEDIFRYLVSWKKSMVFLPKIEDNDEKVIEIIQRYIENASDEDEFDADFQIDDDESYIDEFRASTPHASFETGADIQEEQPSLITTLKDTVREKYKRLISLGKLPTNHSADDLKKRLKSINRDMQKFTKELGTNPYYLSLGMLEWKDPKQIQELNLAPILLIPVEIVQKNRFADFKVRYTDEEVELNDTLYEKLQEDFGIQLPSKNHINLSDIQDYFTLIEETVKEHGWKVDRRKITLTVFASKKFLMQKDLKIDSWPEEFSPEVNSTLDRLLHGGFQRAWQSSFQHTHLIDSLIKPMDVYQIYDADSSQLMAIHHVMNGHDLVIQGPPGTGKSQTITNIIAQAIGDDKTVLFVAQKETALKVVKTKLEDADLGQLCLKVHGDKKNRSVFLNEIQRALEHSSNISTHQTFGDIPGLIAIRDVLNNYSKAINTSIDEETKTPFQCFEELLHLKKILLDADPPKWPEKDIFNHTRSLPYHVWLPKIDNLQMLLAEIGMPQDNVFQFCQYSDDTFIAPEQTRQIVRQTQNALGGLKEATTRLATHLKTAPPTTRRQAQLLAYLSEHILQAPPLTGLNIRIDIWRKKTKEISDTISALRQSDELQRKYNNVLIPEAWARNVESIREQVHTNSNLVQRFFNLSAKIPDGLIQLCFTEPPKNVKDQLALLNAIIDFQRYQETVKDQEPLVRELLGEKIWHEMHSDWKYLSNLNNWLDRLHQTIQTVNLSYSVLEYLESGIQLGELRNLLKSVENSLNQHEVSVSSLVNYLQLDEESQFGKDRNFITQNFTYQDEMLNSWFTNINQLKDIIDYNRLKKELIADGFISVIELGEVWSKASKYLVDIVKYTWFLYLINQNRKHKPELMSFNRIIHESNVRKFCKLDVALFKENRSYLTSKYKDTIMELNSVENPDIEDQLQLLKRQYMNAGTKLSIRKIMENAGQVVQTLKPVFMMDPTSVAKFLPPGKVEFDLVIFDEASQIRPEDATGAILRGKQTVVVGDRYQLPPTNYFTAPTGQNDNLENVLDAESILDLFDIGRVPNTTLLWHYRSQHHSLIAPSNHAFYNDELIAFPSPKVRDGNLGISFFYVSDSIYGRGGSRTNLVEARYVAQAVIHHAANDSGLSLGVVALHKKQAELIEHEINFLRDQRPYLEDFFEEENNFFVKSLENVQGDEREVVFISIGYGFSKDGRLTLQFGPISQEGGDKRLNVLTTRAKKKCVVFSSIRGRDILERRPSSRGAQYLAEYLEYAETGVTKNYEEIQTALYETEDYQQKHDRLIKLTNIFKESFNLDEIKELCFHLVDIDYENLSGDTKQSKARDLASYFHRRENINQIIQIGEQLRPEIDWSELDCEMVTEAPDEIDDLNEGNSVQPNLILEDRFHTHQKHPHQISQLEKEVAEILEAHGYCIEKHVGPPNAAIPIAVMDEKQQTALLGIEFDGPNYYQSRSARDRDRLRRQELEKLQWKIHRIWIIDWYYNKEREINRLIQAISDTQLNEGLLVKSS